MQRHADDQRDRRGDQRPDQERERAEDATRDVPVVIERETEDPESVEGRPCLDVEPDEEEPDEDEDPAGKRGEAPLERAVRQPRERRPLEERAVAACR
jgi:hypothetical protein